MPKSKDYVSSSEGSGSDEERPKKKLKNEEKSSKNEKPKEKRGSSDDEDSNKFEIGKNKFVSVRSFRGKTLIDIREFYEKDGDMLPGKKGISLQPDQWEKLKSKIDVIDKAVDRM